MTRFAYGIGISVIALMLAGCTSGGSTEEPERATAPQTQTQSSAPGESAADVSAPDDLCALYDNIDRAPLISTEPGEFNATDDECSFGAAGSGEYASASIKLGHADAIKVIRGQYEGELFNCDVVDVAGLGDEAFTCFGGRAASRVVFTEGDVMVMFSAGNSAAGPPTDSIMIDAAQQISTNLKR